MPAVVAIYPGEVDGRRCGAACKDRLRILSSKHITWRRKYGRTL